MNTNEPVSQKRIVSTLDYTADTAKRATWESFSFTVSAPQTVHVINESYGDAAADHAYDVAVDERDGVFAPIACDCPADEYQEGACKHRLAVALAGPVLVGAAMVYSTDEPATDAVQSDADPAPAVLAADGGELADAAFDHDVDAARDEDLVLGI